ncbi:MAG: primosomal protein N' [Opitutales bacterium]|nr:primosomal protein N' [Opitutales bacterium]
MPDLFGEIEPGVAEVVPFDGGARAYSYSVPAALKDTLQVGQLVRVPLGGRTSLGVVWKYPAEAPPAAKLRSIILLEHEQPVLTPDVCKLAEWMAGYYGCGLNSVLETVLPAAVRKGVRPVLRRLLTLIAPPDAEALAKLRRKAPRQAQVLDYLAAQTEPADRAKLVTGLGISQQAVDGLLRAGVIKEDASVLWRVAYNDPFAEAESVPAAGHTLNVDQLAAVASVSESLDSKAFKAHLLHGVTGSGKTEVYVALIRKVVAEGGSAIFLVPEVALTPQTVGRLRSRLTDLGAKVVVWHSHLSAGERFDAWMAMSLGQARVVVGARSAVFAPLPNLRLIVVDEEHEPSFKQGETPMYHGRDVAVMRASVLGAACVLGSATPSLETWKNATAGRYVLNSMPKRVDDRPMPAFRIVDMRREVLHSKGQNVLSRELVDGIHERLRKGEQTILFLNRRGHSRSLVCPDCGEAVQCPRCSVSLTLHSTDHTARCHLCDHREPAPAVCPKCRSPKVRWKGYGTQKVEEVIHRMFPRARVARIDADTMGKKDLFRKVLSDFRAGRYDMLLGTQMIAKGLDFPRVTLVGIIDADLSLQLPDFRAAERTFQLLTQVAGRAGRGQLEGAVVVQTFQPASDPVQFAKRLDFQGFAAAELVKRSEFGYPPERHLIRHVFRGRNVEKVNFVADAWVKELERLHPGIAEIRGPAPCPFERVQDQHRVHIWYFVHGVKSFLAAALPLRTKILGDDDVIDVLDVDAQDCG